MAAAASIVIAGTISNAPTGSTQVGPITLTAADANAQRQHVVLASGANTIVCPVSPTTSGCLIVLPSTGTSPVTLKGIAADTGVPLGKGSVGGSHVLNWGTAQAPTSFILDSVSAYVGVYAEIQFW